MSFDLKAPKALPKKLYKLLRLAVEDAKKISKMKGYELYMGDWVEVAKESCEAPTCRVCMAGAVMVCEFKADKTKRIHDEIEMYGVGALEPNDYGDSTGAKLFAINDMRTGDFVEAYEQLYGHGPNDGEVDELLRKCGDFISGRYDDATLVCRAPWRDYMTVANWLEKANV